MGAVKGAGIWVACGLIPVAFLMMGLLSDKEVIAGALLMPLFMVSLLFWLWAGLVMFATWQEHRVEHRQLTD
jgi:protein-S-isoprenylcysteine O-methyltransferase Ste14